MLNYCMLCALFCTVRKWFVVFSDICCPAAGAQSSCVWFLRALVLSAVPGFQLQRGALSEHVP